MSSDPPPPPPSSPPPSATTRLRRQWHVELEAPSRFARLRRFGTFLLLAVRKGRDDDLTHQSAALAFITFVSLIPLLAAFSFVGARMIDSPELADERPVMVELLTQLLPYSEDEIVAKIEEFLVQARSVRGYSFAIFVLTALTAFLNIEESLNRIWNLPRRRPFRVRLWSFTVLLFWGPLLIGAAYSLPWVLNDQDAAVQQELAAGSEGEDRPGEDPSAEPPGRPGSFQRLVDTLATDFLPFAMTVLGLTMLYWLVPYTQVLFRAAVTGGITAAVLLEALRWGFQIYIEEATAVSMVYGSLGAVFFFILSIQLMWWIVLLGSETAYCTQHFLTLVHARRRAASLDGSWLGLLALVAMADRFRRGKPITPQAELADQLSLPAAELVEVLRPLEEAGLVRETSGDAAGMLLARDPHELRLSEVFSYYEETHWQIMAPLPDTLRGPLEELRAGWVKARDGRIGPRVIADLLSPRLGPPAVDGEGGGMEGVAFQEGSG